MSWFGYRVGLCIELVGLSIELVGLCIELVGLCIQTWFMRQLIYRAGVCRVKELVYVQKWLMDRVGLCTELVYVQSWFLYRVGLCIEMVYVQRWFIYRLGLCKELGCVQSGEHRLFVHCTIKTNCGFNDIFDHF